MVAEWSIKASRLERCFFAFELMPCLSVSCSEILASTLVTLNMSSLWPNREEEHTRAQRREGAPHAAI